MHIRVYNIIPANFRNSFAAVTQPSTQVGIDSPQAEIEERLLNISPLHDIRDSRKSPLPHPRARDIHTALHRRPRADAGVTSPQREGCAPRPAAPGVSARAQIEARGCKCARAPGPDMTETEQMSSSLALSLSRSLLLRDISALKLRRATQRGHGKRSTASCAESMVISRCDSSNVGAFWEPAGRGAGVWEEGFPFQAFVQCYSICTRSLLRFQVGLAMPSVSRTDS